MIDPFKTTGILGAKHFDTDNNIETSIFAEINRLRAENERLREVFSNLKSIFRVNMLRAFPETSHEVIDGYIAKALGETDD